MNPERVRRRSWFVVSLFVVIVVAAACAPDATQLIISPQLGEQLAAREAGNIVAAATPTPLPRLADLTPEEIVAGLPEDFAAALAAANPANGEQIALVRGCVGCHSLDPNVALAGPTWHNIGDTAVSRVRGESPALYLYESIVNPNAFVVPNYPANVMPANFGELLSTQELADLVAYLLSLSGQ
ncbi:MAG: cytochrome c [Caldilinea sp.]|nr:cytochrome c [Caldilinea sp.]MDW8440028.1 cytochrome c [Caldilineaceae bacterium]